ncbi:MAG: hypothetical protein AcusKO_50950 [Acuticoccus sp.]
MRPQQILMHVGHGKTGSSFLQSALANSVDVLGAAGIAYPIAPDDAERARAGKITSGNLPPGPGHFSQLLRQGWDGPLDRLLLSSESYFTKMRPNGFLERIRALLPDAELRILLYIRDPLDHAVSNYQQVIKRHGFIEDFDSFLDTYNIPRRVAQFIAFVEGMGATVSVRNYSRVRGQLKASLEEWLSLGDDALKTARMQQVNRSMTMSELALQMAFNRHYGANSARFVSDPLCEELPDIRSEKPPVSSAALQRFLERMTRTIAEFEFGDRLAAGEDYKVATLEEARARFEEPYEAPVYTFTAEQLDALARSVCAHFGVEAPQPLPSRREIRANKRRARTAPAEEE